MTNILTDHLSWFSIYGTKTYITTQLDIPPPPIFLACLRGHIFLVKGEIYCSCYQNLLWLVIPLNRRGGGERGNLKIFYPPPPDICQFHPPPPHPNIFQFFLQYTYVLRCIVLHPLWGATNIFVPPASTHTPTHPRQCSLYLFSSRPLLFSEIALSYKL